MNSPGRTGPRTRISSDQGGVFKTLGPLSDPIIAEIELIQNQLYINLEKTTTSLRAH